MKTLLFLLVSYLAVGYTYHVFMAWYMARAIKIAKENNHLEFVSFFLKLYQKCHKEMKFNQIFLWPYVLPMHIYSIFFVPYATVHDKLVKKLESRDFYE